MSDTPVFDSVVSGIDYAKSPLEWIDRYTPNMIRAEGFKAGLEHVLEYARSIAKPTKQVQELTHWLEVKIEQAQS